VLLEISIDGYTVYERVLRWIMALRYWNSILREYFTICRPHNGLHSGITGPRSDLHLDSESVGLTSYEVRHLLSWITWLMSLKQYLHMMCAMVCVKSALTWIHVTIIPEYAPHNLSSNRVLCQRLDLDWQLLTSHSDLLRVWTSSRSSQNYISIRHL